jgi:hypothetical protein
MLIAATPAMACGSHRMKAGFEGVTTLFNPDPVAVAERCPDGYQWILGTAGEGYLKTPVYRGEMTMVAEHCSRWLTEPGEVAEGQLTAGFMTMYAPTGDELWLKYRGFFHFEGDLEGEYESTVRMKYKIVGGTGVFEDASGRGFFRLVDIGVMQVGRLKGIILPG